MLIPSTVAAAAPAPGSIAPAPAATDAFKNILRLAGGRFVIKNLTPDEIKINPVANRASISDVNHLAANPVSYLRPWQASTTIPVTQSASAAEAPSLGCRC